MFTFATTIANLTQQEIENVVKRLSKHYGFDFSEAMRILDNDEVREPETSVPVEEPSKKTEIPVEAPVEEPSKKPSKKSSKKPSKKIEDPVEVPVEEPSKKSSKKIEVPVEKPSKKPSKKATYVKPKHPLPWTGHVVDTWCKGLRPNHGMLSQCTQGIKSDGFCNTCFKQFQTKGRTKCGTVEDRIAADVEGKTYFNPETGKAAVKMGSILSKLKTTKEAAIAEGLKFGIEIPETEFEVSKKRKGRPPAEKPKNKDEDKLDALIAKAVSSVTSTSESEEEEAKPEEPKQEEAKPEEQKPEEPKQEEPKPEEANDDDAIYNAETDDEEEVDVKWFEHEGKKYLKDEDEILYDPESKEAVGVWNKETNEIDEVEMETDDEEE
jgi:hypothetical protein